MQDYVKNHLRREFVIRHSDEDPNAIELYEPFYDDLHCRVTFVYSENLKGDRVFIEEESHEVTVILHENDFLLEAKSDLEFILALASVMSRDSRSDFTIATDFLEAEMRAEHPDLFDDYVEGEVS